MEISKFIKYNQNCPICQNPLSLFMKWNYLGKPWSPYTNNLKLFKGISSEESLKFNQFYFDPNSNKDNDPYISFSLTDDEFHFHTIGAENLALTQEEVFLYYICQPSAISSNYRDYEINVYNACYYRSSIPAMFHKYTSGQMSLLLKDKVDPKIINRDETFAIKQKIDDLEKIYILSINNLEDKTLFWQYSVSDEQAKDSDFEPSIFETTLPHINPPDLTDKNSFINRMNSWILLS